MSLINYFVNSRLQLFKRWIALFTGCNHFPADTCWRNQLCYPVDLDSVVQPWFEQLHPTGQLKLEISSKTNDLVTCESSSLFIASTFSITSFPPTWAQKWQASITSVTQISAHLSPSWKDNKNRQCFRTNWLKTWVNLLYLSRNKAESTEMTSFQDVQAVPAGLPSHRESTTLNARRQPQNNGQQVAGPDDRPNIF